MFISHIAATKPLEALEGAQEYVWEVGMDVKGAQNMGRKYVWGPDRYCVCGIWSL